MKKVKENIQKSHKIIIVFKIPEKLKQKKSPKITFKDLNIFILIQSIKQVIMDQ